MSREQCRLCKAVSSTTVSPNKLEGWFVDDEMVNELEILCEKDDQTSIWLLGWLMQKAVRVFRCPECGGITVMREAKQ